MTGKWECFMFILEDKHKTGEPAEPEGFISWAHLGEKSSAATVLGFLTANWGSELKLWKWAVLAVTGRRKVS